jgi:hypothetical protein
VNGVNPATFKFGSAPTSATDGVTLGAASVSGGQGGSLLLSDGDSHTTQGDTPVDAVYAYSALGTTIAIEEGMVRNVSTILRQSHFVFRLERLAGGLAD